MCKRLKRFVGQSIGRSIGLSLSACQSLAFFNCESKNKSHYESLIVARQWDEEKETETKKDKEKEE